MMQLSRALPLKVVGHQPDMNDAGAARAISDSARDDATPLRKRSRLRAQFLLKGKQGMILIANR